MDSGSKEGERGQIAHGYLLKDIPEKLGQVFSGRRPVFFGPLPKDRQGLSSVFVPVRDPSSGAVLQVLGIDASCGLLFSRIASERLVFILLAMLALLLQVAAFTFRQLGKESQMELEDERRKFEAQAMESQKLESLGVLAGGIAHDFNNILQGIIGNTDLAIRSGEAGRVTMDRLDRIRSASLRAAELCKLMLVYTGKASFDVARLDLGMLFEPFFSTKFAGRGLGLAAVQGIVRGHGGAITIDSTPGKGSLFRVYLPARPPEAGITKKQEPVGSATNCRGAVLFVDDEEDVREVGASMLEHLGFDVMPCPDGRRAVQLFEEGTRFDAVLLDMTMPLIDGAETLRGIRKIDPAVPVIMASGYDEGDLTRKFSLDGIAVFLHKPFSIDALEKAMAAALGKGKSV